MRPVKLAAAWLAAFLLAACAQLQTAPPGKIVFELNARLAARYGAESFSGNLAWRHAERSDEMLITTPMGQGVARIVREGDAVTLTTAEPKEYHAADAESITEQVLGFRLPLAGLADWVQARPSGEASLNSGKASPNSGDAAFKEDKGPDGRLLKLEQSGWRIEYQEYDGERPKRLRLLYPGIELRLAISSWK
jgi:outer membrane lipoprotein LolB